MDSLGKIFGSPTRVKMMRLFLFHADKAFAKLEIGKRVGAKRNISQELNLLQAAGFIKKRFISRYGNKRKVLGWTLNQKFPYLAPVQNLLIDTIGLHYEDLIRRFGRAGSVKLLIVAGVFIKNPDSRVDILIVGDRLRKNLIEATVRKIQTEIGAEIRFCLLETSDFNYRLSVSDKLIRDILEFPHRKLLDRLGLRNFTFRLS